MNDKLKVALANLVAELLVEEERPFAKVHVESARPEGDSLVVEAGLWSETPEDGGMPPTRRFRVSISEI